ncbi:Esterase LovG [Coniochaeta hoffmannii]|uniref:Esterase LovG n=1 Tax=Coniochaeta hoffmannii TaxID=91930 RepID=A0AA38S5X9_9PEZI|nr:Esterase LovG [Coniochaeta hoffmannii]
MASTNPPLHLARILCLHGGGVNATVFRLQCRRFLTGTFASHFRLVFVDAPFPCPAHPAIERVYGDYGPFYRWLRWQDHHEEVDASEAAGMILSQCKTAMDSDPGTGDWVGVLGFSQGAKIAASLLWLQERVAEKEDDLSAGLPVLGPDVHFRFGVIMAGSAPLVNLDPTGELGSTPRHIAAADSLSMSFADWPGSNEGEHAIKTPTLHVHGLQDPGLDRHNKLISLYCKEETARLVEWDGDHRIPIKTPDVDMVVSGVLELARETGCWQD